MKLKYDFITNSSSTNFMLFSKTTLNLLNRNLENKTCKTLIYQQIPNGYKESERDNDEGEKCRDYSYKVWNSGNQSVIEIDGYISSNYESERLDVVSTGKNLRCIEKCLNQIDKEIKLPNSFEIHFEQNVECQGDGWGDNEEEAGDYSFSGQGYIFKGSEFLAHQSLDKDLDLQCIRNQKGKIKIDFPKVFMRLGR